MLEDIIFCYRFILSVVLFYFILFFSPNPDIALEREVEGDLLLGDMGQVSSELFLLYFVLQLQELGCRVLLCFFHLREGNEGNFFKIRV